MLFFQIIFTDIRLLISCIIIASLILFMFSFAYFYIESVSPATLIIKKGPRAHKLCKIYRQIAFLFLCLALLSYLAYFLYPLPQNAFPRFFLWSWQVSVFIGIIGILFAVWISWLSFLAGIKRQKTGLGKFMTGGIYNKIRYPQVISDVLGFFVFSFLLHSPLLVIISIIWIPIYISIAREADRDLLIRYGYIYRNYMEQTGQFFPRIN